MTSLSININTDNLMKALLKTPDLLASNMSNAVELSLFNMSETARRYVHDGPMAFSTLIQSIKPTQFSAYEGIVKPGVNYASIVETGSGAGGWPQVDEIKKWVRIHEIEPNDPSMSDRRLAWVIAKSISLKGTPPQPYLKPAFDDNVKRTEKRLNRAITAALEGKKK